ncbi:MAG: PHP domain-containing protein [Phascolarctobacterium sp.]
MVKKDDGMLWGKKIKGPVRTIDSIIEEENRIVIEGTFVKSLDKDGNLQTFVEHEMRNGVILLTFNVSDDTNGIFIKMRFDNRDGKEPRKECNAFKDLLKPGMRLRIQGNAAPDRFAFDEMTLMPHGIMKLNVEQRMDNAAEKRVELHCHTKMSKMDGLTPMEDLVKQAIRWGHKALAITDHGVVQAFPFCFDRRGQ